MEFGNILSYLGVAGGGAGLTQIINWRLNRRKEKAQVKQDEIEVIRKTMEDVYMPTIELQNKQIKELRNEVQELRGEVGRLRQERNEYRERIEELQAIVNRLSAPRARDPKGRYMKSTSSYSKTEKAHEADS